MAQQEKSFRDCTLQFLEKNFQLEEVQTLPALEQWVQRAAEISEMERQQLLHLRQLLRFNVHDWNEPELDTHFIGPIFALVNYSSKKFNHFVQRELSGVVIGVDGEYRLYGKPDGMIASGRRLPEKPFFAFQEYKRTLDPDGDPAGQALAAMLVGQSLDEPTKPIYGCYVVGRDWHFMALQGKQYAITQDYSAITDDIFTIYRILQGLKQTVIELAGADS